MLQLVFMLENRGPQICSNDEWCLSRGFDPKKLSCKFCLAYFNATLHESLAAECLNCCQTDKAKGEEMFTKGSLWVNPNAIPDVAHLEELLKFVESRFPKEILIYFIDFGSPKLILERDGLNKTFNLLECDSLCVISYLQTHFHVPLHEDLYKKELFQ